MTADELKNLYHAIGRVIDMVKTGSDDHADLFAAQRVIERLAQDILFPKRSVAYLQKSDQN